MAATVSSAAGLAGDDGTDCSLLSSVVGSCCVAVPAAFAFTSWVAALKRPAMCICKGKTQHTQGGCKLNSQAHLTVWHTYQRHTPCSHTLSSQATVAPQNPESRR